MRVLVTGGRDYDDVDKVYETLDNFDVSLLIYGKARGADALAEMWADERGVPLKGFEAQCNDLETPPVVIRYRKDGSKYNAAAGGIRNQRMVDEGLPDLCVAFDGGTGTADCVRRARAAGIQVIEVQP